MQRIVIIIINISVYYYYCIILITIINIIITKMTAKIYLNNSVLIRKNSDAFQLLIKFIVFQQFSVHL